jgi:hypothetical protein
VVLRWAVVEGALERGDKLLEALDEDVSLGGKGMAGEVEDVDFYTDAF